ncbi:MAG: hypothetical protein COB02_06970 [Candidatus Cloacimonadota bacterium]|nr:MAG: hypothetical protein COB02_06970 [Candidatus Cloacimonadota bacterium]
MFSYRNKTQWSLGAKSLKSKLLKEFEEALDKSCEEFLEIEKRSTVTEEDLKICLLDLVKKMSTQDITLLSAKFTEREFLNSLKIVHNIVKKGK